MLGLTTLRPMGAALVAPWKVEERNEYPVPRFSAVILRGSQSLQSISFAYAYSSVNGTHAQVQSVNAPSFRKAIRIYMRVRIPTPVIIRARFEDSLRGMLLERVPFPRPFLVHVDRIFCLALTGGGRSCPRVCTPRGMSSGQMLLDAR